MRLRLERMTSALRGLRFRGWAFLSVGAALELWAIAIVWVFIGAFVLPAPNVTHTTPPPDAWGLGGCLFFAAFLPMIAGIFALTLAWRAFRAANELEELFRLAGRDGRVDRARAAETLPIDRVDRMFGAALAQGVLVDSPLTMEAAAPPYRGMDSPMLRPSPPASPPLAVAAPLKSAPPPAMAPVSSLPPPGAIPQTTPNPLQAAGLASARPPTAPRELVGRTLKGTYIVEARLAQGGMGAIYAARHTRTGRRVAIKTLLPDERMSEEAIRRFEREAKAASSIGHAGIVAVYDFDRTEDGVHYLVMELLEGESLEDRLARVGRLAWPEARALAREVADALAAAHRAGVLHRDLKPSNVFLARREGLEERAILVDFGLAKPIREGESVWVTRTGAVVGTAHYMAPEQARGERVDVRADVYGLGALVYEMVAGVPPFLGSNPFAVMTMLLTEQPVAPSSLVGPLPPGVDALLLRALAKTPGERPPDVPTFAAELASL